MVLILAYAAGLLTLINPCVIPVLPIVLASALHASRYGPVALALGMSLSFVGLGISINALGYSVGINPGTIAKVGAFLMMVFGTVLLVPILSRAFSTATVGVASRANSSIDKMDGSSVRGQFLGGLLLGVVWSPCVGPTLGGALALASQGENLIEAGSIMIAFAFGVSTLILGIGYVARSSLTSHHGTVRRLTIVARPVMGLIFVVTGFALFYNVHYKLEAWLVDVMPDWLLFLSVSL
ncbi:cytochrome c biogenesis CcdA family protein [Pseudopelagicola sp. nBUS_19]|uniref:cytochrome c biogenesis CcdA family protein n=1 Tax=Pseudopelagicola sp. nBUS_19 TaxID=3395316 RepID=UPI003EB73908